MNIDECYKILGLENKEVTEEEIRKQYKKLAFETHPDRNNGNSENFIKVAEAYEILSGKAQQKQADDPASWNPGFDPSAIFSRMNFGDFFNQRPREVRPPANENEIVASIRLSVGDIKQGKDGQIRYRMSEDCKSCSAQGGSGKKECPACSGKGSTVKMHRQGSMVFQNVTGCSDCRGTGVTFDVICQDCSGRGWKVFEKVVHFEIKEKK